MHLLAIARNGGAGIFGSKRTPVCNPSDTGLMYNFCSVALQTPV